MPSLNSVKLLNGLNAVKQKLDPKKQQQTWSYSNFFLTGRVPDRLRKKKKKMRICVAQSVASPPIRETNWLDEAPTGSVTSCSFSLSLPFSPLPLALSLYPSIHLSLFLSHTRLLALSLHAPAIPTPSDARHPGSGEWQRHVLLGFEGLPQWEEYESSPEPCPPTAKYIRSWSEAEKRGSKSPKSW